MGQQRIDSTRLLLHEIALAGRIPRIDLSARTGVSRATVTTITSDLLRGGLIEEVARPHSAEAGRGRPKVDLRLRGEARLVAGLKVGDTALSLVLMDFVGREIGAHEYPLPTGRLPADTLAEHIAAGLNGLCAACGQSRENITGVGVALAGLIDAESGTVHWSPSLDERNVALGEIVTAHLGCPAFIDNDANLVAIAELHFGLGRQRSDFIVVTIESGVGMGIVLGGQLYRGKRGSGGEFGHIKVQLEGALCRCEQRGCLEAYVADYALQREAASVGLVPRDMPPQAAMAEVLEAAARGEGLAQSVVQKASQMFAMGLANLVNIFDPELIILAGEQMQLRHLYAEDVIESMRHLIIEIDKPDPEVVIHKWGSAMWARGAAAYALSYVRDMAIETLDTA